MIRYVFLAGALVAIAVSLVVLRSRSRKLRLLAVLGTLPWLYGAIAQFNLFTETWFRFKDPWFLPLCAATSFYIAWRDVPTRLGPTRRRLVLLTTWSLGTALALLLALPELGHPVDRMAIVVAVDASRSMELAPGQETRIRAEIAAAEQSMHEDDTIATVLFASDARLQGPLRKKRDAALEQAVTLGRDTSDIEAGIRRALIELPADATGKIVLITDGVETRGNAISAAISAALAETPIDTVVIEQRKLPELRIAQVLGPKKELDEHEPAELRIVTQSSAELDAELRISRDGKLVRRLNVHLAQGEDVIYARDTTSPPGMHRYDVEITATNASQDGSAEDNAGAAFVRVKGRGIALLIEAQPGGEAPTERALREAGFLVNARTPANMPQTLTELIGYDLVVWGSLAAHEVSPMVLEALANYTRDAAGGVLLLGGASSFGPGGYSGTPIEAISPVSFELKKDQRKASLAEVIAIDYSGSMGMEVSGKTKLALANEAAARSAALLNASDKLGVAHVDTVVAWTIPLGPVADAAAIGSKIRSVGVGGGGIYTDLALRAAYEKLRGETVNLKHVLLFADGSDAEQLTGCRALVQGAFRSGITTSVISLGKGSDTPELEVLSRLGNGRFYLIDDATRLPSVFTQETILASRSSFREEVFVPKLGAPSPLLRGIDLGHMPQLKGYVVTQAKPRAEVSLFALDGDPLLASWSIGLGKSSAFTSDYHDRWGAAWLGWPEAATMFGQVARGTARSFQDTQVRLETMAQAGRLTIRASARDTEGRAAIHKQLVATVTAADGTARDVTLTPTGAGTYGAELPLARQGSVVTTLRDGATAVGISVASFSGGDELRGGGSNHELCAQIASTAKGKVRTSLAGIFDERGVRRVSYEPLDRRLLWLAGALLLLMVAARRLSLPALPSLPVRTRAPQAPTNDVAAPSWLQKRATQKQATATQKTESTVLAAPANAVTPPPPPVASHVGSESASTKSAEVVPAPQQTETHAALSILKRKRERRD